MYEENKHFQEDQLNENTNQSQFKQTEENYQMNGTQIKPPKKTGFKGLLMAISGGVLGSAITLTAVPYLPNYQEAASETKAVENTSAVPAVNVKQVSTTSHSLADTVEQASKAIVGIVNYQKQSNPFQQGNNEVETGSGSGVIFKKDLNTAYIVTNNHVIENANKIEVTLHNGDKMTAELIGTDSLTDIAVLKISGNVSAAEPLTFGDSSQLRAGDQVLAIGNPLGLDLSRTVTQGIVSAVNRTIPVSTSAGDWDLEVIQTDAAINPGNSGGALINTAGQLVGINSMKISESGVEGLGFAIPSKEVKRIINELIENGQVVRPYFGVSLADLDEIPSFYRQNLPATISKGTIIATIDPNSAAAKAGLQSQDIIVSIGGKEITNSNDFRKTLYSQYKIGDKVKVEFYRQGELKTVEVTLQSNKNTKA
ncbi:S1C family serine protease [Bacillus sp. S/N-304-OC-R1]|uniref:S1C family serine protease n=1 Tax=Bacillus sp. S/N-304-OC-R1 TaxID=2758034 RepID=UPI001C8EB208|nr:trypsin-like peptidase domain-containing protein [Bacillus sp. S/N-304-OC-R1]MBY0123060.1 trypsin-like peptidase domain-containing protein [Bacillus sp. S/N-304-OC-R1]